MSAPKQKGLLFLLAVLCLWRRLHEPLQPLLERLRFFVHADLARRFDKAARLFDLASFLRRHGDRLQFEGMAAAPLFPSNPMWR